MTQGLCEFCKNEKLCIYEVHHDFLKLPHDISIWIKMSALAVYQNCISSH